MQPYVNLNVVDKQHMGYDIYISLC